MRQPLFISLVMALAVTGTLLTASGRATASVPPSEVKALQFNICGAADACVNKDRVVTDLLASLNGRAEEGEELPDVITLNEVCRDQFADLAGGLGAQGGLNELGYEGEFGKNIGAPCGDFGNAVFVRGPVKHVDRWSLPNLSGGEARGMICVSAVHFIGCATHISLDKRDRGAQIRAVAFRAEQYVMNDEMVIIGGDFNATPGWRVMDMLYEKCYENGHGNFGEADASPYCSRNGALTHKPVSECGDEFCPPEPEPTRKIDYLFFDTQAFKDFSGEVTHSVSSDHEMLWGTGQVR